jgi:hypothetical protein
MGKEKGDRYRDIKRFEEEGKQLTQARVMFLITLVRGYWNCGQ